MPAAEGNIPTMDQEALQLLKRSVPQFNRWRAGRPLDLRQAQLPAADLRNANLTNADLAGANLAGARLTGADLRDAHLDEADLHGADLRGVRLQAAQLAGTNLQQALLSRGNLRMANLERADLRGADLRRADLRQALLAQVRTDGARFQGADLRGAQNVSGSGHEALDRWIQRMARRSEAWAWIRRGLVVCLLLVLIGFAPDWMALLKQGEVQPNPFVAAHLNLYLGQRLLLEEKYPQAVERFRAALAKDPEMRPAYVHLAFAYDSMGRHREAERAFARFLELQPTPREMARLKKTLDMYGTPQDRAAIARLLKERGHPLPP